MSIADEIRSVLQEVGSSAIIHKPDGTEITNEFMDDTSHPEHTNASIRAFFYTINLHSPTAVVPGDTIRWGEAPNITEIMVTNIAPQMFQNEVVEYIASGYVVNSIGKFWHYPQDAEVNDSYDEVNSWVELYPDLPIRATVMDRLYRSMIREVADNSMSVEDLSLQMFISDYFSEVAMGMQWRSEAGRVYKVDHIEDHNFVGIRAVFLSEETRP